MIGYIYKVLHRTTGKYYIGSTKRGIEKRFEEHMRVAEKKQAESGSPFYKFVKEQKCKGFEISLLKEVDAKDLKSLKQAELGLIKESINDPNILNKISTDEKWKEQMYPEKYNKRMMKKKEKTKCECGCEVSLNHLARHKKSMRHKELMNLIKV